MPFLQVCFQRSTPFFSLTYEHLWKCSSLVSIFVMSPCTREDKECFCKEKRKAHICVAGSRLEHFLASCTGRLVRVQFAGGAGFHWIQHEVRFIVFTMLICFQWSLQDWRESMEVWCALVEQKCTPKKSLLMISLSSLAWAICLFVLKWWGGEAHVTPGHATSHSCEFTVGESCAV